MPIEKVPVVHKFGIISHSQRLELQERLLKQSYLQSLQTKRPTTTKANFEVSEEFVNQYNHAHGQSEQAKFADQAHKILERIKRKCGLKDNGSGNHVDLPVAWTELVQLAQCKGLFQEECLDILITSLDQAPFHKSHIVALFYIAETTIYWLRTEAVHQPYLRTGEIKLLKMGQLAYMRLFYHHMSGQLQSHVEFKSRLFTYLDGFGECQTAYNPYPNALLCLRFINEVGKMIVGDFNIDSGEIKGDKIDQTSAEQELHHHHEAMYQGKNDIRNEKEEEESVHSRAISSSVHDLSPTLWHALDVWRCFKHSSGGQTEAILSLGNCGMGLGSESWVDVLVAVYILGDAAKDSCLTLRALINLAAGIRPKPQSKQIKLNSADELKQMPSASSENEKVTFSDINEINEAAFTSANASETEQEKKLTTSSNSEGNQQDSTLHTFEETFTPACETAVDSHSSKVETIPPTTVGAVGGSFLPCGRASEASTVPTFTNVARSDLPGINGWHWEVAVAYCDVLTDICIHGSTSNIRKLALIGNNKDISYIHRKPFSPEVSDSAGLIDLVYFKSSHETKGESSNDWSWRVRYSAIHGLVKVCRCCVGDQTKEGVRTVAWNALLKANSLEKDLRVLEALKVGQVDVSIENVLRKVLISSPCSIGGRIAAGLSVLYLPPLPPPVEISASTPRRSAKKILPNRPVFRNPPRTSLKQEIQLATALYEPPVPLARRGDFDLRRVVEDQWRKELHKQQMEQEEERQKELKKKQDEREQKQKEIEEKRKALLKDKYRGKAYQVPGITTQHQLNNPSTSSES